MQFDTTINPMQFNIAVSEEDGHMELVIVTGTFLQVGPGQALPIPIGIYRTPFPSTQAAQDFYTEFGKAIAEMPDDPKKSDILVAGNVNQANQMAEQLGKLR
jgi:hypothetical protein